MLFSALIFVNAQDIIIKKSGEEIKAKVKAVTDKEIEYSKFENPDGPSYKIPKADVLLIMYPNGTKDVFANDNPVNTNNTPTVANRPAQHYYSSDFFIRTTPVTYLGIDFSKCKLIGDGFENPKAMFTEINLLLQSEKHKYDIDGAIRKPDPLYEYTIVNKRNDNIVESTLTETTNDLITFSQLQAIVDEYDLAGAGIKDGLCLVIIAESLNKTRVQGNFFYVVLDVASKKILISDRFSGRAGGHGLRNYWAKSVYETIMTLRSPKYGIWKAMYRK